MAAPVNETVEQRILDNIEQTLQSITVLSETQSYWTTVKRVHVMDRGPLEVQEFPSCVVLYENTKESYSDSTDGVYCELYFIVYCVMPSDGAQWRRDIKRFAADVKTALRLDVGRGTLNEGANAFDTTVLSTDIANAPEQFPVAIARIDVQVQYRHPVNDPTAAI